MKKKIHEKSIYFSLCKRTKTVKYIIKIQRVTNQENLRNMSLNKCSKY